MTFLQKLMPMPTRNRVRVSTPEKENGDVVVVPHPFGGQQTGVDLGKAALRLKVVQNPAPTFFKDEGGKKHVMSATFRVENPENSRPTQIGKVALVPTLCYENGYEVEDGSEIFKVLSLEPKVVTSTEQNVVIKFRIEKVSRRKDGKRFKVRMNVGQSSGSSLGALEVFTTPVCVLSKRKFNSSGNKRQGVSIPKRMRSGTSSSDGLLNDEAEDDYMNEMMGCMQRSLSNLDSKVATLAERVVKLERENEALRFNLKRSREEVDNLRVDPLKLVKLEDSDYSDAVSLSDFMHDDDTNRTVDLFELTKAVLEPSATALY